MSSSIAIMHCLVRESLKEHAAPLSLSSAVVNKLLGSAARHGTVNRHPGLFWNEMLPPPPAREISGPICVVSRPRRTENRRGQTWLARIFLPSSQFFTIM